MWEEDLRLRMEIGKVVDVDVHVFVNSEWIGIIDGGLL